MLRKTKLPVLVPLVFCILGVMLIPNISADQPVKHLTYGDCMAAFQTGWTGGDAIMFRANEHAYIAAPYDGFRGRINPFIPYQEFCVEDAHFISVTAFTDVYGKPEINEWYKNWTMWGRLEFRLKLDEETDWTSLETVRTALKPMYRIYNCYGFSEGVVYRPGELGVGEYNLHFVWYWDEPDSPMYGIVMETYIDFTIHTCNC